MKRDTDVLKIVGITSIKCKVILVGVDVDGPRGSRSRMKVMTGIVHIGSILN